MDLWCNGYTKEWNPTLSLVTSKVSKWSLRQMAFLGYLSSLMQKRKSRESSGLALRPLRWKWHLFSSFLLIFLTSSTLVKHGTGQGVACEAIYKFRFWCLHHCYLKGSGAFWGEVTTKVRTGEWVGVSQTKNAENPDDAKDTCHALS